MNLNSKIGIGTVQFGMNYGISNGSGQTPESEVGRIFEKAYHSGIKIIDTAIAYGNAQEVIGKHNCSRFSVVSKFLPSANNQTIKVQLEESLKRLNISSLYGFLAHRPSELHNNKDDWEELKTLKEKGKVSKIGFSLNTPSELHELLQNGMFPDLIQVPYNYFDNRFKDQMIDLKAQGCEIHTRSTFLQGLFFLNPDSISDHFNEIKGPIKELQNKLKDNIAGGLLRHILSLDFVDHVIMGIETEDQLIRNMDQIESAQTLPDLKHTISDSILMPSLWPK